MRVWPDFRGQQRAGAMGGRAMGRKRVPVSAGLGAAVVGLAALSSADEPQATAFGREIPAPFAPFEYLIGSWKGAGVPMANRIRGWGETHAWAWKFEKGV